MILFKNHKKSGFSLIEMMVALTLLATFGTSLFLVQTNLFSKLSKTHVTLDNMFELNKQLLEFSQTIQQTLLQKKPLDSISLHHEHTNPTYTVDIKLKPIDQHSKFFNTFNKNIRFVQASITRDGTADIWWNLIYIPSKNLPQDQSTETTPKEPR